MANSLRKCKQCAEYKPAESGVKVPAGWFCCYSHEIEFAREKTAKVAARQAAKRSTDSAKIERLAKSEAKKKMEVM